MGFVIPEFFSESQFIQFDIGHALVEKFCDFSEFIVTFSVSRFDELLVE